MLPVIRAVAFITVVLIGCTLLVVGAPLMYISSPIFKVLGLRPLLLSAPPKLGKMMLLMAGVNLQVNFSDGAKKAMAGGAMLAYNHSSNLDPPIVLTAADFVSPRFIYKKNLAYVPFFGWACWVCGNIPINRKNRTEAISSLDAVVARLKQGLCIAIAPEGTRSRGGELLPFKQGPFHVATDSGSPVVPVVISGAFEQLPPGTLMFQSGSVLVNFLDPIIPNGSVNLTKESCRKAMVAGLEKQRQLPMPPCLFHQSILPALAWLSALTYMLYLFIS